MEKVVHAENRNARLKVSFVDRLLLAGNHGLWVESAGRKRGCKPLP